MSDTEAGRVCLALDVMSGDHGHEVAVDAALSALAADPELELVLVGDEPQVSASLARRHLEAEPRLSIHHADEVVAMGDRPSRALRAKRRSSMRVAIELVRANRVSAAVSAGNTGALMAIARAVLRTLPGIDRPAFVSRMPSFDGHPVYMLDLGANARCTVRQLVQFAAMGSALVTAMHDEPRPRIGLLNVGVEEIKGTETIQEAARQLQASTLNYTGFVEGDGVFLGPVDVVVSDGFAGNVALKAGEGVARLLRHYLEEESRRSWLTRAAAAAAMPILRGLSWRVDPRRYNGATLLGLNGTVVKSHGGSDAVGFAAAIRVAAEDVRREVPTRIRKVLEESGIPALPRVTPKQG